MSYREKLEPRMTIRRFAVFAVLLALVSCTGAPSRHQGHAMASNGSLVLGQRSAKYWGLAAGTTYPEVARADLPAVVATSVDQVVAGYKYNPSCTRYFHAEALFLITTATSCARAGTAPGAFDVAAFDSAGGAVHVSVSTSWDTGITILTADSTGAQGS